MLKFIEDKPRIILFAGSNVVSSHVFSFLLNRKENIVHTYNEKDEILLEDVKAYKPDIMITCYWPFLLNKAFIDIPKYGCINFHPALLPKNRGWYPSVWPFIDGSPAGVTLHLIDEGADTGPIIAQDVIPVLEIDNGGTIYEKCQDRMISLFKETWVKLWDGIESQPQDHSQATYHTKKEGNDLNEIYLHADYTAEELFNWIKSRVFGNKTYAYYKKGDSKYKVSLSIVKDE